MAGQRRERVVRVVPRLAAGEEGERREVGAAVAGAERTLAERVAHRVDRPRQMVAEADAQDPGEHQCTERASEGAGDRVARRRTATRASRCSTARTTGRPARCRGRRAGRARRRRAAWTDC